MMKVLKSTGLNTYPWETPIITEFRLHFKPLGQCYLDETTPTIPHHQILCPPNPSLYNLETDVAGDHVKGHLTDVEIDDIPS